MSETTNTPASPPIRDQLIPGNAPYNGPGGRKLNHDTNISRPLSPESNPSSDSNGSSEIEKDSKAPTSTYSPSVEQPQSATLSPRSESNHSPGPLSKSDDKKTLMPEVLVRKVTCGGKMFRCTGFGNCTMSFSRSEHLARHIRKHTGERPFHCECGRAFSRLDNLRQHIYTVHANDPLSYQAIKQHQQSGIAKRVKLDNYRRQIRDSSPNQNMHLNDPNAQMVGPASHQNPHTPSQHQSQQPSLHYHTHNPQMAPQPQAHSMAHGMNQANPPMALLAGNSGSVGNPVPPANAAQMTGVPLAVPYIISGIPGAEGQYPMYCMAHPQFIPQMPSPVQQLSQAPPPPPHMAQLPQPSQIGQPSQVRHVGQVPPMQMQQAYSYPVRYASYPNGLQHMMAAVPGQNYVPAAIVPPQHASEPSPSQPAVEQHPTVPNGTQTRASTERGAEETQLKSTPTIPSPSSATAPPAEVKHLAKSGPSSPNTQDAPTQTRAWLISVLNVGDNKTQSPVQVAQPISTPQREPVC